MSRLAVFVVCAATAVAVSSAEARDGCGQGWFFNGVACAPMERGYAPPPGFGYRPEPQYYQPRYYDGSSYYRGGNGMYRGRDGQLHCNNRTFTIQNGVCKPYRGG